MRFVRRSRGWIALLYGGAITVLLLSPLGAGFMNRLENLRDLGSMTLRIWYFREAWLRLLEHLPWGMGLWQGFGNADKLQGTDPHNFWLLIGGDLGLPGVLLWAIVSLVIVRRWRDLRADETAREQAFTILLTLVLAQLHTLVEPTFQGPHYQLLFYWVVCGTLAYATASSAQARERVPDPPAIRSRLSPAAPGASPSGA